MEIIRQEMSWTIKGSGLPRTKANDTGKLHLSDIAKFIEYKMQFGPKNKVSWNMVAAAEAGFLWEDFMSLVEGSRYAARIGEVEKDNIVGSPDGIDADDPFWGTPLYNVEYKATWRSVKKEPPDIWYWMTQFKSYCYMLGVDVTVVKVLYLNGDYRGSGPIPMVFGMRFTDKELLENWRMILSHRDEMLEKGFMDYKQSLGEDAL
jgi:hypothetical protein